MGWHCGPPPVPASQGCQELWLGLGAVQGHRRTRREGTGLAKEGQGLQGRGKVRGTAARLAAQGRAPRGHRGLALPLAAMELMGAATLLLLVLAAVALVARWQKERSRNLPPGPLALPLVGNLLQLGTGPTYKVFRKLSEKYGPVFSLHFGSQRVVVVFGYEMLREVLVTRGDEFTDRGHFPLTEKANQNLGLFMSNGAAWVQMRRFTLATLRDFGMGKRGLEEQVQEETGLLLQELARTKGQPLDPSTLLTAAMGNSICRILFGHRFDYGDEQYLDVLRRVAQNFLLESSPLGKLYNILPGLLERLPGSHWTFFHNTFFVQDFLTRKVEENAVAGEPTTAPRDFSDAFLRKMEQEKENPKTAFTQDNLRVTVFDIFLAGTETTSMTLRYCLMVLLQHPDVAEKIQEEIERVIGMERPPALRDRAAMPYTDAVIHEVQRFLDLIPLGFVRTVARDTPLGGFTIPKGCTIYPVLSSALKDPRHFKNPEVFDPQHFLDEKGAFKKNEAFIPFSAGKRMCLGESMVRTQLFLFLTAILQRFRLRLPPGEAPPDLSPRASGISNVPWSLRVCFCPR